MGIEARFSALLHFQWVPHGEPGKRLTVDGERNENIYYLLNGMAEVRVNNALIAILGEHTFVGDMSLVTGDHATATVELVEPGRYISFPIDRLTRLLHNNAEVRRHLKAALSGHLAGKLLRTSRDLGELRRAAT